jgi:hypothetical protein
MTPIQSISIPKACQQQWQQMIPVNNGRHCESCSKVVIDFTKMTNAGIINYLSAKSNVCGRFEKEQFAYLNRILSQSKSIKTSWKKWTIALIFTGLFTISKAEVRMKNSVEIQSVHKRAHHKYLKRKRKHIVLMANSLTPSQIKTGIIQPPPYLTTIDLNNEVFFSETILGGVIINYSPKQKFWDKIKSPFIKVFNR